MGKKQVDANQANKGHKTLREKLRKKRQQLKKHKKEKSQKHKQYDSEEQKKKFFQKATVKKSKREDGIKQHRLTKHIQKFVDLYEDDVEDFYDLFETLDQGGQIDISGVADPKMQKCLKKMFKYLPLVKNNLQYRKKPDMPTKLKTLMKQLVSRSIQNYLQNGTDFQQQQQSEKESSDDNENEGEEGKKRKKNKSKKEKKQSLDKQEQKRLKAQQENKNLRQYQKMKLYSQRVGTQQNAESSVLGPFISAEQRQLLAKMVEQQAKQEEYGLKDVQKEQDNEFERIFSMSTGQSRKGKAEAKAKPNIDDIPQQLLAEGSARIGQKQQIDPQQIEEYNKAYRPRKLVEEYQQMRKIGKYAETDENGKKKRIPFDRERDIVNGRSRQFMNNGVFFDFKQRMTKPKSSNNFL